LKLEAGAVASGKRIHLTLIRSTIGALKKQKACFGEKVRELQRRGRGATN
jgi:hypothetical protein